MSEDEDTNPEEERKRERELALHELHHATLVFWVEAGGVGDARAKKIATVLEAITACLRGLGDERTLDELYRSAAGYFDRVTNTTGPFASNGTAGADELYDLILNRRLDGADFETIAAQMIDAVHRCRPGIPGIRPYYAAKSREEALAVAGGLREKLVKALDKVDRDRRRGHATPPPPPLPENASDNARQERILMESERAQRETERAEEWADAATRAVLRALDDPHADNALKHRMKK